MADSKHYKSYYDLLSDKEGLFGYGLVWWCTLPPHFNDYEFSYDFLRCMTTKELKEAIHERIRTYDGNRFVKVKKALDPDYDYYRSKNDYPHRHLMSDGYYYVYTLNPLYTILEETHHLVPNGGYGGLENIPKAFFDLFHEIIQHEVKWHYDLDLLKGANRVLRNFQDRGLITDMPRSYPDIYSVITKYANDTYKHNFNYTW